MLTLRRAAVVLLLGLLLVGDTPVEGKKKKKKGKEKRRKPDRNGGGGGEDAAADKEKACDVEWNYDDEENKDLVCAACRFVLHEVQHHAMDRIRKKHTKEQRGVFADEAITEVCGSIKSRKMAFHGQKPGRVFIDWLKQLGRGMEELSGSVCMGPMTQDYLAAACSRYTTKYYGELTDVLGKKKYQDLRRIVCEKMEGKCEPPGGGSGIEEDTLYKEEL